MNEKFVTKGELLVVLVQLLKLRCELVLHFVHLRPKELDLVHVC